MEIKEIVVVDVNAEEDNMGHVGLLDRDGATLFHSKPFSEAPFNSIDNVSPGVVTYDVYKIQL